MPARPGGAHRGSVPALAKQRGFGSGGAAHRGGHAAVVRRTPATVSPSSLRLLAHSAEMSVKTFADLVAANLAARAAASG